MGKKIGVIIGAGPAGLSLAYELITRTDIKPIVIEKSSYMGGISRTVDYKGNKIDIGGHRFYSKSERVVEWWSNILPKQSKISIEDKILKEIYPEYLHNKNLAPNGADPEKTNKLFLIRNRLSRILFLSKLFNYPISLSWNLFVNIGPVRILNILISYLYRKIYPLKVKSLEDFFKNNFGDVLYKIFFKDYTEKVWGVPCSEIPPEWGNQRVKQLSVMESLKHALKKWKNGSLENKNTVTSLIGEFLYPKYGPGMLWEEVARLIKEKGGEIYINSECIDIKLDSERVSSISYIDSTGLQHLSANYVFSTMPISELFNAIGKNNLPEPIYNISQNLQYRSFITVGLLLNKLKLKNQSGLKTVNNVIPDNWIYIQEKNIKCGRVQIFNNWSPYMVKDINKVWIGLEYFCDENDDLWSMSETEMKNFAISEMHQIQFIEKQDIIDSVVISYPKTYPSYFGEAYKHIDEIIEYVNKIPNLFLLGRNGMHKYNNMDHSVLCAMTIVDNLLSNITTKDNLWKLDTEKIQYEYQETKKDETIASF
ncbi:MAG: NAD(P)/FAD-dependent oxidoreductase [Marinifilaceae bacterium]|jgi:protoporphyrinogen oxidase|nr:NAD(P)/FAD-dependent oxidoreductase [Marinifilaceae bacterium]